MRSSTVTVTMMLVLKCSSSEADLQPDLIIFIFSDTLKDSVSLCFENSEKRKDNFTADVGLNSPTRKWLVRNTKHKLCCFP